MRVGKANLLSLAGRHILIQSSSSAIADYVMQGDLLPSLVYQEIGRANHNFLWGSTSEKRKIHLINWNIVTLPIDQGGLGIHAARPRNLALLAKLDWKLSTCENMM